MTVKLQGSYMCKITRFFNTSHFKGIARKYENSVPVDFDCMDKITHRHIFKYINTN